MPKIKPRTKSNKPDQLSQPLEGEMATYEKVGLFQRSLTKKTAYLAIGACCSNTRKP